MNSMISVSIFVLISSILYWLYWRLTNRRILLVAKQLAGPPPLPILGNALTFMMMKPEEQFKKIGKLIEQYGDYTKFWLGPQLIICIKDPHDIKHLLTSNKVNKKGPSYEFMVPFMGRGILIGGPNFRAFRKILNPSYTKKSVDAYKVIFNEETERFATLLTQKDTKPFDVYQDAVQCTTKAVCRTLMTISEDEISEIRCLKEVVRHTQGIYSLIFSKISLWWLQISLIFRLSGYYKKEKYYLRIIDEMVSDIIERRRQALNDADETIETEVMGVIDRFLVNGYSADEIKFQVFTLFSSGQEPSAKIASSVLLILAHLPEWQDKVYKEIMQVIGDSDECLTREHFKKMPYLDMVFKETIRYFSIGPFIQRRVQEDVTIKNGEITIPAGAVILLPIHEVHRDPRYWDEPNKIKPERFSPDNKIEHKAFLPFSLGAMDCLGRVFGIALIKTLVVKVLRQVELSAKGRIEDLDLHAAISVEVTEGYNVSVRPRNMTLLTVCILALVPAVMYWLYWRWTHRHMLLLADQVPGPPALPILGNALTFMIKPEEQLKKIAALIEQYGDYTKFWLGPELIISVKDPNDIRQLLTSNKVNQKGPAYDFMTPFIGKGILTGGPKWRIYRKIANPAYSKKSIEKFEDVFNEETEILGKILNVKDEKMFDVYFDVLQCTTRSVCRTLMDLSADDILKIRHLNHVARETQNIYGLMFSKMTRWWLQIPFVYWLSGHYRRQKYYLNIVNEMISDIIEIRRKKISKGVENDVMGVVDRFIVNGLSETELKFETFALFTTSQEASAKIASGVLLFLAHLPEWQDRVYNEIMEVVGSEQYVTEEHFKKLTNLDLVYKEVLRYLSIAPLIQRTVEEDITINNGKITLPAGSVVVIPIHEVHRDPRYWDEPLKIKPERFSPDNKRDQNAFIPFSLGLMDCLGRVYATALIKTLVVKVLRQVELTATGKLEDLDLNVAISVEIIQGYNLSVRPRNRSLVLLK
ncbi:unnamed protein product [Leptosia nina]|uniref:Cytochrome P450 n=1 Tax=Leptosia nina TaxID=320188 RepID=A0AAV1IZZ1_9NEOP